MRRSTSGCIAGRNASGTTSSQSPAVFAYRLRRVTAVKFADGGTFGPVRRIHRVLHVGGDVRLRARARRRVRKSNASVVVLQRDVRGSIRMRCGAGVGDVVEPDRVAEEAGRVDLELARRVTARERQVVLSAAKAAPVGQLRTSSGPRGRGVVHRVRRRVERLAPLAERVQAVRERRAADVARHGRRALVRQYTESTSRLTG